MMAVAAGMALAAAGLASASTVDVSYNGLTSGANFNVTVGSDSGTVGGGRFNFGVSDAVGTPLEGISSIRSFCIELNEFAAGGNDVNVFTGAGINGQAPFNDGPGQFSSAVALDLQDLRALSWLFDTYFETATSDSATATDARAFQLAVWEIVYEVGDQNGAVTYGIGSNDGNFFVTGGNNAARNRANEWLAGTGVAGDGLNGVDLSLYAINSGLLVISQDGFQDQITLIPLPGAALMGLVGLGGAFAARRRLRQG
jgi:hypothetical protein